MRLDENEDEFFGGECLPSEKTIKINSKYDDEMFLDYLHHELLEGATFLIGCSYTRFYPDRQEYFLMDHTQLDVISSAVRGAYGEVMRKMEVKDTGVHAEKKTRTPKKPTVKKTRASRSSVPKSRRRKLGTKK